MLLLNLLPWRERQRLATLRRFQRALVGSLCLALGLVLLIDQLARQRLHEQAVASQQRERAIAVLDTRLEPLAQLRAALEHAHGQSQALADLRAGQQRLPTVLGELERALPEGVQLTALTLEGAQLQIAGLAISAGSLIAFIQGLEMASGLREPQLKHMQRQASGEYFRLTVHVSAAAS